MWNDSLFQLNRTKEVDWTRDSPQFHNLIQMNITAKTHKDEVVSHACELIDSQDSQIKTLNEEKNVLVYLLAGLFVFQVLFWLSTPAPHTICGVLASGLTSRISPNSMETHLHHWHQYSWLRTCWYGNPSGTYTTPGLWCYQSDPEPVELSLPPFFQERSG